jgi:hypothetical protein
VEGLLKTQEIIAKYRLNEPLGAGDDRISCKFSRGSSRPCRYSLSAGTVSIRGRLRQPLLDQRQMLDQRQPLDHDKTLRNIGTQEQD